jgi:hypothetical protein
MEFSGPPARDQPGELADDSDWLEPICGSVDVSPEEMKSFTPDLLTAKLFDDDAVDPVAMTEKIFDSDYSGSAFSEVLVPDTNRPRSSSVKSMSSRSVLKAAIDSLFNEGEHRAKTAGEKPAHRPLPPPADLAALFSDSKVKIDSGAGGIEKIGQGGVDGEVIFENLETGKCSCGQDDAVFEDIPVIPTSEENESPASNAD